MRRWVGRRTALGMAVAKRSTFSPPLNRRSGSVVTILTELPHLPNNRSVSAVKEHQGL
jgi:hypothetical protein